MIKYLTDRNKKFFLETYILEKVRVSGYSDICDIHIDFVDQQSAFPVRLDIRFNGNSSLSLKMNLTSGQLEVSESHTSNTALRFTLNNILSKFESGIRDDKINKVLE
jgi:hypothetical protein